MSFERLISNWAGTRDPKVSATLNHAGDSIENPIVAGFTHKMILHKHDASETMNHVWLTSENGLLRRLDSIAVETDYEITVTIVSGRETEAGTPPVKNTIHFSTSEGHYWCDFFVASLPLNEIKLNGYNAENEDEPLIWPFA